MLDLDAIEFRVADCSTYNFGMRNADRLAHEDAPALVAEVRRLQAVIDEACDVVSSASVPLGVPVARHLDALLATAYRVLRGFE